MGLMMRDVSIMGMDTEAILAKKAGSKVVIHLNLLRVAQELTMIVKHSTTPYGTISLKKGVDTGRQKKSSNR